VRRQKLTTFTVASLRKWVGQSCDTSERAWLIRCGVGVPAHWPRSRQLRHDLTLTLLHLPYLLLHIPINTSQPQLSSSCQIPFLLEPAATGLPLPLSPLPPHCCEWSASLARYGDHQRARHAGHAHRGQDPVSRPDQEVQAAAEGPRRACAAREGRWSPPASSLRRKCQHDNQRRSSEPL
jgi:hypothetical protein